MLLFDDAEVVPMTGNERAWCSALRGVSEMQSFVGWCSLHLPLAQRKSLAQVDD